MTDGRWLPEHTCAHTTTKTLERFTSLLMDPYNHTSPHVNELRQQPLVTGWSRRPVDTQCVFSNFAAILIYSCELKAFCTKELEHQGLRMHQWTPKQLEMPAMLEKVVDGQSSIRTSMLWFSYSLFLRVLVDGCRLPKAYSNCANKSPQTQQYFYQELCQILW